jgi:hypothetical protein
VDLNYPAGWSERTLFDSMIRVDFKGLLNAIDSNSPLLLYYLRFTEFSIFCGFFADRIGTKKPELSVLGSGFYHFYHPIQNDLRVKEQD